MSDLEKRWENANVDFKNINLLRIYQIYNKKQIDGKSAH